MPVLSFRLRKRRPPIVAKVLAVVLAAMVLLGVSNTATAAPPYETEAEITSLEFSQETVGEGGKVQLNGSWALPDNPTTPAGFTLDLPEQLRGEKTSFALLTPDGETMGQCEVEGTQMFCDFDPEYLEQHPKNLRGTFELWVVVDEDVDETTTKTYVVEDIEITIEVTPPGQCTENCEFTGRPDGKAGDHITSQNAIFWGVLLGAPEGGAVGGEEVEVVDTPGPGHEILPDRTTLQFTDELVRNSSGREGPGNYRAVPADEFEVSADGTTVNFTTREGYYYRVVYYTEITDPSLEEFANEATITTSTANTVNASTRNRGGTGTGIGDSESRFVLTKEVINNGGADVAGLTYSGTYQVTSPEGQVTEGTWELTEGEPFVSPTFAENSTLVLTENVPVGPEGATWAEPVFSVNDATLPGGEEVAITVTNEVTQTPPPSSPPPSTPSQTVPTPEPPAPATGSASEPAPTPAESTPAAPATTAGSALAATGSPFGPAVIGIGLLISALGAGALIVGRRLR